VLPWGRGISAALGGKTGAAPGPACGSQVSRGCTSKAPSVPVPMGESQGLPQPPSTVAVLQEGWRPVPLLQPSDRRRAVVANPAQLT
jgi:hypothetical protein